MVVECFRTFSLFPLSGQGIDTGEMRKEVYVFLLLLLLLIFILGLFVFGIVDDVVC